MDYNDVNNIISGTVDSLNGVEPDRNSIQFNFKLTADYFHGSAEYNNYRDFRLLVKRDRNYKAVFSSVDDAPWEFQSYHDSCWRTDGLKVASDLWFEERESLLAYIKEKNKTVEILEINQRVKFRPEMFRFLEFVQIEMEKDGDYSYKVIDVQR